MKIWTKTKNGLRKHTNGETYYVNATVNGRSINRSTGTTVKADARRFCDELLASLRAPDAEAQAEKLKAGITLAPYLALYRRLAALEQIGDTTRERKGREIGYVEERWAEFRTNSPLASEDPRTWTVIDLLEFQKFLGKHYTACVANRYARILSLVLELVEDDVKGFRSPHRNRRFETIPVGARAKVALPSEDQFCAVLAAIRAERNNASRNHTADLAEGLAYSNLRIDEARRLRVSHVNLEAACLELPAEIVKGKKSGRTVPLGVSALALFRRLVEAAGPDGVVFKADACNRALKRACLKVGCGKLSHHKLRHWWATIALEKTGDAKQVSEWLGHRDGGKLVLATYTHTRDERAKALAAKLDFNWSSSSTVIA